MAEKVDQINMDPLDTTETDKWVGKPLGGGQLKEPITITDIRRWAQGMHNPNPLYYDDEYAAKSAIGEIVAPQSFTVNCTVGHGATPAIQGYIPGTHMLFGGDEWWFYGPRIRPGTRSAPIECCSTIGSRIPSSPGPRCFPAATPPTSTKTAR